MVWMEAFNLPFHWTELNCDRLDTPLQIAIEFYQLLTRTSISLCDLKRCCPSLKVDLRWYLRYAFNRIGISS